METAFTKLVKPFLKSFLVQFFSPTEGGKTNKQTKNAFTLCQSKMKIPLKLSQKCWLLLKVLQKKLLSDYNKSAFSVLDNFDLKYLV